jgi:DNA-binding transcriptional LysR family regulator
MQLESLKMFCDVVETGSFSRAARLNHVTQSAISQQIRALEARYEQKLLYRRPRATAPTPLGERLYRGCRVLLTQFAELEQDIRTSSEGSLGTCSISAIYSVGLHELQPFLRRLLVKYPKLNVRISYRRNSQVYEEVANGNCDLGIVAYPAAQPGLEVIPFLEDNLVFVCPPGHRLGARPRVPLKALSGESFIAFDRDAPTRRAIDRILKSAGVACSPTQELDNVETIKQAIALGLGVSILPRATVLSEVAAGALVARPLLDGSFTRPIGIVLRKDRFLSRGAELALEELAPSPSSAPGGSLPT